MSDAPHYSADPAQLELTLPLGKRVLGQPICRWQPWSPQEQFEIDCRYDGIDGHSTGRWVEETVR